MVNLYPRHQTYEIDDVRVEILFYGVFQNFEFGRAQAGDPKGSVKIKGKSLDIQYGTESSPINLGRGSGEISTTPDRFRNLIKDKYTAKDEVVLKEWSVAEGMLEKLLTLYR